ncbi:MAG: MFS transporter [Paludibacteraceae bacterium]|nr:MFS transporter [Paludibacteraceae bacterium]
MKKNTVAIITMMFLFAMISFVTNLAAPIGVIWKNSFIGSPNANAIGMIGNAMVFLAYLFMGIPSGKMLAKIGYKNTAMFGVAACFVGVLLQWLSGMAGGFVMYLCGAFVSGLGVCMLNTVVNPMLVLIGGGGNRGNQLNLIGGTLNSLTATLTPMLVGAMIGLVTVDTKIADVNIVLYIAMAVLLAAFLVLMFTPIEDPESAAVKGEKLSHSPWSFRHFVLGAITIFFYVGTEVGIPGGLIFFLSDSAASGLDPEVATSVAGFVAGTYWFMMLIGRFLSGFIANRFSSRQISIVLMSCGVILIGTAMFLGTKGTMSSMILFTGSGFESVNLPVAAILLVLCGLCTSALWSCIFSMATAGLGKYTAAASGIFMTMVVGGGVLPLLQNFISDNSGYMVGYMVPLTGFVLMLCYAIFGSKNVNKDIEV